MENEKSGKKQPTEENAKIIVTLNVFLSNRAEYKQLLTTLTPFSIEILGSTWNINPYEQEQEMVEDEKQE